MFEWAQALINYGYDIIFPKPPPGAAFGYRRTAGQGVPGALTTYDVAGGAVPGGVYVVFNGSHLDGSVDPFGRAFGGPGPVYPVGAHVSNALTTLVASVARNPPPGEGGWTNPPPGRLLDVDGFLAYGATCLNLINATPAGAQLLAGLGGAAYPVFISPGLLSNQTFSAGLNASVDQLTKAIADYASGGPVPVGLILNAVNQQYAHIVGAPGRFAQLVTDMNAAPLYSLFVAGNAFQANYLANNFQYQGGPLTGPMLQQWVGPGGFPGLDATVRGMTVPAANGVKLRDIFLLALSVALHGVAPHGAGAGAGVKFFVQDLDDNVLGSPGFRPPAVGLCHELMHARHYTAGTSPGYDINHFTTTTAELMFAGIGPSATDPVNENAVRGQWAAIGVAIDPSNVWAAPVQRLTYEPPVFPQTPATLRAAMHCL